MTTKRRKHSTTRKNFDDFVDGYVGAALWSETDNSDDSGGEPLDKNYGPEDIAKSSMKSIKRDCAAFFKKNKADLAKFVAETPRGSSDGGPWSLAGYCFWLNRNGHGTGFWDRDVGDVGDRLSEASHKAGNSDIYVGDDGKLYVSPER